MNGMKSVAFYIIRYLHIVELFNRLTIREEFTLVLAINMQQKDVNSPDLEGAQAVHSISSY